MLSAVAESIEDTLSFVGTVSHVIIGKLKKIIIRAIQNCHRFRRFKPSRQSCPWLGQGRGNVA